MRFTLPVFCALAVFLRPAAAQREATPPGTGLILGRVVDAETGAGVPDVIVTLGDPSSAAPIGELVERDTASTPAGQTRQSLSAADGSFLFRSLPKGRYMLTTAAPAFVPGEYGQNRPAGPGESIDLDDGQRLGGVAIRVWKVGAITGTVVDENGDPAVGVQLRCLRRVIDGGHPRFSGGTFVTTDDRGIYRAADLVPGDYVIGFIVNQQTMPVSAVSDAAAGRGRGVFGSGATATLLDSGARVSPRVTGYRVGDLVLEATATGSGSPRPALPPAGRLAAYQTKFYPNASAASQATVVTVKSGQDRQAVDLQLRLVPAVNLSGIVTGPDGAGRTLGLTLMPVGSADIESEGVAEGARTVSDGSGHFTFLAIPAGQYLLKVRMYPLASFGQDSGGAFIVNTVKLGGPARGAVPPPPPVGQTLWAVVPVSVADRDIDDLAVTLKPGNGVSGRVQFVGTHAPPTPDQIQRLAITLQNAEGRTSSPIPAAGRATPDGSFRTAGYPAGRYIVAASSLPPGWTIRSIVSGGHDVSVEPLELSGADATDVVLTFTDRTTMVTGTVSGATGSGSGADVLAFPADSMAWKDIGVVARRWRDVRAAPRGGFTLSGLPPGDYFIVAVPAATADTRDPKVLERLVEGAARITLADGGSKTIAVKMSPLR